MIKGRKVFLKVIVILIFCMIYISSNSIVFAASKIKAQDLIGLFESGWEQRLADKRRSGELTEYQVPSTERKINQLVGEEFMNKIHSDYERIKIRDSDLGNLSRDEKNILFAGLNIVWQGLNDREQELYQGEGHFNFQGIFESVNDDHLDDETREVLSRFGASIYKSPENLGRDEDGVQDDGADQIIQDGDNFIEQATTNKIDNGQLQVTVSYIYNIFLQIAVGVSVIIALILGIKFMLSSVEEKAEMKKMLVVYVISCVVVFGSFGIWKLVINILDSV